MANTPKLYLHYSSFSTFVPVEKEEFASKKFAEPAVQRILTESTKKALKNTCGIELKPDETLVFEVMGVPPQMQAKLKVSDITTPKFGILVSCKKQERHECPIITSLKHHQVQNAELMSESLIREEELNAKPKKAELPAEARDNRSILALVHDLDAKFNALKADHEALKANHEALKQRVDLLTYHLTSASGDRLD